MAERKQKVSIPLTVLSVLIAVIVVFPIVWMVLSSFKPSGELFSYPLHLFSQDPTVEHYASVLAGGFMGYVKNSLFLAVVGTLITLVISSMCGYALAIYRFEIKYVNLVFGVFLLGTLIPGETLTVPQFSVISALGLYNNIWGVILPVVTTTTGIFMYRQHYMSIPLSFVEAARIDGANEARIQWSIVLPLITPTLFYIAVTTCIEALQAFAQINILTKGGPGQATTTITYNIYTTAFNAGSANFGIASALGIVLFLFVFVLTLLQFRFLEGKVNY